MSAPSPRVLVLAKAPVPGLAKTRLAASVGTTEAAELAAAALLDTLDAARGAVGVEGCVLALAGDLDEGSRAGEIRRALSGWTVIPQRGEGFAARLVGAHRDAGPGPTLQVGMDTPQATAGDLEAAASLLRHHDAVLGAATDGGWWLLGRHDPAVVTGLLDIVMSSPTTGRDTHEVLAAAGCRVAHTAALTDVDEYDDAAAVAAAAPRTRFARRWQALEPARLP